MHIDAGVSPSSEDGIQGLSKTFLSKFRDFK
jgi:hypothetical protein